MEILTIILTGLMSLGSSGGMILDKLAQTKISSQIISVEQQALRIDNQPSYNVARGRLERVRIASRGVLIEPGIKIAALDLETDPLAVKVSQLKLSSIDSLRQSLDAPATAVARMVINEADLNQSLQSPKVQQELQDNLNRLIMRKAGSSNISYSLTDIQLELRPQNQLQVSFKLARPRPSLEPAESSEPALRGTSPENNRSRELAISLQLTVKIIDGQRINLVEPQGTVNGSPMSPRLLNGFATGISDRLDLNILEEDGILARILQLEIDEDNLQLVGFVRLETKKQESSD